MKIPFTVLEFYLYVVFYLLHSAQKYSLPHVETKKNNNNKERNKAKSHNKKIRGTLVLTHMHFEYIQ